ncbi:glycosyltransferase family 2 protein [Shewanella benthica]|nr:glycosyltransferase family 2 protein [Shewanella benthica]
MNLERERFISPIILILMPKLLREQLNESLQSILAMKGVASQVVVWCENEHVVEARRFLNNDSPDNCGYAVISELVELERLTNSQNSCFIINCGDRVHASLNYVLAENIDDMTSILYCDTDSYNHLKQHLDPKFKPNWNPDLQLTTGYVSSGIWVDSFQQLYGKLILSGSGIAQYLMILYLENNRIDSIKNIPLVLVSQNQNFKLNLSEVSAYTRGLLDACGKVTVDERELIRIEWNISSPPLVSLIIPTRNGLNLVKACIESILTKTTYAHYEILLIDNNSDDPECLSYFDLLAQNEKIRVISYKHEFNYSAINNFAVSHANGDIIGLINNDVEVISPDWLSSMVGHAIREDIGCVGAKLLYSNELIQHAGVVLGYGQSAGHAHKFYPATHSGYMNRLVSSHNVSAVTAACLLVKKELFEAVNGLNEKRLSIAFNDVDFCLKVQSLHVRNVYCAEAVLFHHESVSRGLEDTAEKQQRFRSELNYLREQWPEFIQNDPAYNPNLTLKRENFSIKGHSEYR